MTRVSELGRPKEVTVHCQPDANSYFYRCETCGQMVDCKDMWQVLWHEQDEHEPLELDS